MIMIEIEVKKRDEPSYCLYFYISSIYKNKKVYSVYDIEHMPTPTLGSHTLSVYVIIIIDREDQLFRSSE